MVDVQKWLSHYPEEISTTLDYDEKPLQAFLEDSAKIYGEKIALTFMGKKMSFSELYKESKIMAHYMQSLGLKKGGRVAIMLPNCPQGVISYYATLLSGAIVVQTNPLYTERELEYQLKDAGATKIAVIKLVKEATGLGLKEAKELVDGAPKTIKEAMPKADAEKLAEDLKAAGATVEMQ